MMQPVSRVARLCHYLESYMWPESNTHQPSGPIFFNQVSVELFVLM